MLREVRRCQGLAVALPADHELLQGPPTGRSQAAQQFARRGRADVMHDDELGMNLLELLLQRRPGVARHEQFALIRPGDPADLAFLARQVLFLVAMNLRGERGLGACGVPSFGGGQCSSGCA